MRIVLATAAFALAAGLVVLAAALSRLSDDLRTAPGRAAVSLTGTPARGPLDGLAAWFAEPGDELALAHAVAPPPGDHAGRARLPLLARGAADARVRAQAATVLAVEAFRRSLTAAGGREALLAESVARLREAVRLDPENEAAKYDLELLLSLITPRPEGGSDGRKPATEAGAADGY